VIKDQHDEGDRDPNDDGGELRWLVAARHGLNQA
jgi:hypothetical protein